METSDNLPQQVPQPEPSPPLKPRGFTIGEAFSKGWELTKQHIGFLVGYFIVIILLSMVFHYRGDDWHWFPLHFIGWIVGAIVDIGFYKSALMIYDGIKPGFDQLYKNWRLVISWIVSSILFTIMFAIGLLLLIFPAFWVLAAFGFFPYFVVDKQAGPVEALQESARITKGYRWQVLGLMIAMILLNMLGILLFFVGILVTAPLSILIMTTAYRKLLGNP